MKKVFEFKPEAKKRDDSAFPATLKPRDYSGECGHHKVSVDEQGREITCRQCKAVLDPIKVLAGWATNWDHEKWKLTREKELDRAVSEFQGKGGKIIVRPSGVVVEKDGRRWASSCSGGMSDQLRSALERAKWDLDAAEQRQVLKGTVTKPQDPA